MVKENKNNYEKDTTNVEPDHRLYILVRTDIPQMNPGKLGAQAAHAGTQFVFDVLAQDVQRKNVIGEMTAWANQGGGGFGTKITLAATEKEINDTVLHLRDKYQMQTNVIVDPTYPMLNYFKVPFTRSELTCGYVFVPDNSPKEVYDYLKLFSLHQ